MDLSNEQWAVVEPLLPVPPVRADGKGRLRIESRSILDSILWILRTGAPEGIAEQISVVPNLPSTLSGVGAGRCF